MNLNKIYIALGSNISPQENILNAIKLLKEQITISAASTFYSTPPIGSRNQENFINGVIEGETIIPAKKLKFETLRTIESKLGRIRNEDKFASRTIDLDIVIYSDLVINSTELILPDPEILTRPFLAFSLYELVPELILPGYNIPIKEIINQMASNMMKPLPEFSLEIQETLLF